MEGTHDAVMLAYATAVEKMSLEMRGFLWQGPF